MLTLGIWLSSVSSVHLRHVDVRQHEVDGRVGAQPLQRFYAVVGEDERVLPSTDVSAHPLEDEWFQVGFVVNHQDLVRSL